MRDLDELVAMIVLLVGWVAVVGGSAGFLVWVVYRVVTWLTT